MQSLRSKLAGSPILVRVVPFALFVLLGSFTGYGWYLVKTLLGALSLWVVWPLVAEMRWKLSWPGVLVGVAIFVLWVGLDGLYPQTSELLAKVGLIKPVDEATKAVWNPFILYGEGALLAWFFVLVRLVGSSLVVPPLEEVFFRSFLYRYVASKDFLGVPLDRFLPVPFLVSVLFFGFEHEQWLAGILCGCAYQGLVLWKGRLGDAMTAHAITNFLLALWVINRGAWQFW